MLAGGSSDNTRGLIYTIQMQEPIIFKKDVYMSFLLYYISTIIIIGTDCGVLLVETFL